MAGARPLICDLDGTIADTAPAIFESLRLTCAAIGVPLHADLDLTFCLGPPLHWCLERLGVPESAMADAVALFEAAHLERLDLVAPMPCADRVIAEVAAAGVPVGVATIKPAALAHLVLERLGLRSCVSSLHARADDTDARTKTDLVREALRELGGPSPLYVGDHDNDQEAAAANGIAFMRYPDRSWSQIRAAVLDAS